MSATQVDRIGQQIQEPLRALGLDLEAVELTPAGKRRVLRVAVDQDGGITLDEVAEATRAVNEALDATDVMGELPYTLEVTSRGVDRPLTLERHWRRNIDRLVLVTDLEGLQTTGRILAAGAGSAEIDVDGSHRSIDYQQVRKAVVQVELNRRANRDETQEEDD